MRKQEDNENDMYERKKRMGKIKPSADDKMLLYLFV